MGSQVNHQHSAAPDQRSRRTAYASVEPPEAKELATRMMKAAHETLPIPAHRVAVVVADTVSVYELGAIVDIFTTANVCAGLPLYDVAVVASEPRIRGTSLTVSADESLEWADEADTVIVPGHGLLADHPADAMPPGLLGVLVRAHARDARLVAVCLGPYLFAAAGLLDGRIATCHWNWAKDMAAAYPRVRVDPDVLYVRDGNIYTGAGNAMTTDLLLELIENDHGATLASVTARYLLSPPRRHGGHAQQLHHAESWQDSPLSASLLWAEAELASGIGVDDIARHASMSVRSLHRHFRNHVGTSPSDWLVHQRVRRAMHLLQTTDWAMDKVARESGFASEATFRYNFHLIVDMPPGAYRRSFTLTAAAPKR